MLSLFQPSHRSKDSPCDCSEEPCFPGMQAEYQTEALERFEVHLDPKELRRITLTSCTCKTADTAQDEVGSLPLVVFSPGFAGSRLSYAGICQAVASHGFTVIATDHPYETEWVQYPDGEVVTNRHRDIRSMADVARYAVLDHPMRVEDVRSILDAVECREVPGLNYRSFFSENEPKLSVGILGHSLGGSTAVGALLGDPRVLVGVNYDGSLQKSLEMQELNKPLLLLSQENEQEPGRKDRTWKELYARASQYARVRVIKGFKHDTFTDIPSWVSALSVSDPELEAMVGSITGERVLQIISKYTVSSFESVLRGAYDMDDWIDKLDITFPEVMSVRDGAGTLSNGTATFEWPEKK